VLQKWITQDATISGTYRISQSILIVEQLSAISSVTAECCSGLNTTGTAAAAAEVFSMAY